MDPSHLRAAERWAGSVGLALLGFYHSHPDTPALPSARDRAGAWPWYAYLILEVSERRWGAARAFELDPDGGSFRELAMSTAARQSVQSPPEAL